MFVKNVCDSVAGIVNAALLCEGQAGPGSLLNGVSANPSSLLYSALVVSNVSLYLSCSMTSVSSAPELVPETFFGKMERHRND